MLKRACRNRIKKRELKRNVDAETGLSQVLSKLGMLNGIGKCVTPEHFSEAAVGKEGRRLLSLLSHLPKKAAYNGLHSCLQDECQVEQLN